MIEQFEKRSAVHVAGQHHPVIGVVGATVVDRFFVDGGNEIALQLRDVAALRTSLSMNEPFSAICRRHEERCASVDEFVELSVGMSHEPDDDRRIE